MRRRHTGGSRESHDGLWAENSRERKSEKTEKNFSVDEPACKKQRICGKAPASALVAQASTASSSRPVSHAEDKLQPASKNQPGPQEEGKETRAKETKERLKLHAPIPLPEPVTAQGVQDALKVALSTTIIHDKPFEVRAVEVKRKKGQAFQLRCGACDLKTCAWRGTSTYKPGTGLLESHSRSTPESHGRPSPVGTIRKHPGKEAARAFSVS